VSICANRDLKALHPRQILLNPLKQGKRN